MSSVQQRIVNNIRFTKFSSTFPKFGFGTLLVTIFCSFLLVIATFTPIQLVVINFPETQHITKFLSYIPQIPVVIMIACLLGPRIGLFAVFLYVLAGLLGFPIFASGGGIDYAFKIKFGYILGFFIGAFVTGQYFSKKLSRLNVLKASIFGVTAIHLTGIIYLIVVLLMERESPFAIWGWIMQFSGVQVVYDLVFGIVAAFMGRLLRYLLWIVTD